MIIKQIKTEPEPPMEPSATQSFAAMAVGNLVAVTLAVAAAALVVGIFRHGGIR